MIVLMSPDRGPAPGIAVRSGPAAGRLERDSVGLAATFPRPGDCRRLRNRPEGIGPDQPTSAIDFAELLPPGAGNRFAHHVTVRYGQLSGELIQILDGLSPADRVIVTGMSKWKTAQRVEVR